jgi:hypothetical protein
MKSASGLLTEIRYEYEKDKTFGIMKRFCNAEIRTGNRFQIL